MSNRRNQIVEAATKIVRTHGVEKFSLRGVAREVGISAPSLYEYFRSKDALIDEIRTLERSRLATCLFAAVIEGGDPVDRLYNVLRAYLRFAAEEPDSFRVLFSLPTNRTTLENEPDEDSPYAPLYHACKGVIETEKVQGHIDDAELLAFQLWALVHGIATLRSGVLKHVEFDMEMMSEAALKQSLAGIIR